MGGAITSVQFATAAATSVQRIQKHHTIISRQVYSLPPTRIELNSAHQSINKLIASLIRGTSSLQSLAVGASPSAASAHPAACARACCHSSAAVLLLSPLGHPRLMQRAQCPPLRHLLLSAHPPLRLRVDLSRGHVTITFSLMLIR